MLVFLLMIIVSAKASWLKGTRVPRFIDTVSLGLVSLQLLTFNLLQGEFIVGVVRVCRAVFE